MDPTRDNYFSVACHPHIVRFLARTRDKFSFAQHPDANHFVQFVRRRGAKTSFPKKFALREAKLGDENLRFLSNSFKSVRELDLQKNGLTHAALDCFGKLIWQERCLVRLDLSHNKIRNAGAALLAEFIRRRRGRPEGALLSAQQAGASMRRSSSSSEGGMRGAGHVNGNGFLVFSPRRSATSSSSTASGGHPAAGAPAVGGSSSPQNDQILWTKSGGGAAASSSKTPVPQGPVKSYRPMYSTIQLSDSEPAEAAPPASAASPSSTGVPVPGALAASGAPSVSNKLTLVLAHCGIDTAGIQNLWSAGTPGECDLLDVSGNHFNQSDFFRETDPADPEEGWARLDISDTSPPELERLHDWLATRIAVSREGLFLRSGGSRAGEQLYGGGSRGPSPKEGSIGGSASRADVLEESRYGAPVPLQNGATKGTKPPYPIRGQGTEQPGFPPPFQRDPPVPSEFQQQVYDDDDHAQREFEWKRRKMIARAMSLADSNGSVKGGTTLSRTNSRNGNAYDFSRTPSQASPMSPSLSHAGALTGVPPRARSPASTAGATLAPRPPNSAAPTAEQDLIWYRLMLTDPHVHPAYLCNHGSPLHGIRIRNMPDLSGAHLVEVLLAQALNELDVAGCGLWRDWRVFCHAVCKSVFHWANKVHTTSEEVLVYIFRRMWCTPASSWICRTIALRSYQFQRVYQFHLLTGCPQRPAGSVEQSAPPSRRRPATDRGPAPLWRYGSLGSPACTQNEAGRWSRFVLLIIAKRKSRGSVCAAHPRRGFVPGSRHWWTTAAEKSCAVGAPLDLH